MYICNERAAEAQFIAIFLKTLTKLGMLWEVIFSEGAGCVYFAIRNFNISFFQVEYTLFIHYEIMHAVSSCKSNCSQGSIKNVHCCDHLPSLLQDVALVNPNYSANCKVHIYQGRAVKRVHHNSEFVFWFVNLNYIRK